MSQRGFGLLEILLVVAVIAIGGYFLMQYIGASAKSVETLQQERPIDRSKLAADRATLTTLQGLVRTYQAEKGQWPPDKATNDFEYDPASGTLSLTITDDARC